MQAVGEPPTALADLICGEETPLAEVLLVDASLYGFFREVRFRRIACGFTLVEIMITIVIVGLLAALAIPGFNHVRQVSQDKMVFGNMRQLASAAEQYFLEYGTSTAAMTALIGPDRYIKVAIQPVAGEVYPTSFLQGDSIVVTSIAGARSLVYAQ